MSRLFALLCCGLLALPVQAQPVLSGDAEAQRPVIGLVLSGGGAKGMAHVGVLRVLEELQIPVDLVVGTSAGSAVAALYALGMPVAEIEQRFTDMNWLSSFQDSPGRASKPVRRKTEDWRYPIDPGLGIGTDGLRFGRGLIAGQNLGFILNELTLEAALLRDFDQLPIRYRAVATDLETGQAVVIHDGSLADAIRASMSIPGFYAPLRRNGRLLVDGGIAANLPVEVAQAMGADIIIAVDISDALSGVEGIQQAFSVVGQLTTLVTRGNVDQSLQKLGPQDIVIRPDLMGLSSANFYDGPLIMELGATAARDQAVELYPLSVADDAWYAYQERRQQRLFVPGEVAGIRIHLDSRLSDRFVRARLRQRVGEPLNVTQLEADLRRIYGLGYFETITYAMTPEPEGTVLDIFLEEKSWGPNYLRFGLGFEESFDGDTRFNITSAVRFTELNRRGGEALVGLQLGTEPYGRVEWFQPLDYGFRRFVLAGTQFQRDTFSVFGDQGSRLASVNVTQRQADISLGTELGAAREVRVGIRRGYATINEKIGEVDTPSDRIHQGAWTARLVHDSLNDPFLPVSGSYLGVRASFERESIGARSDYDRVALMAAHARQIDRYVLMGQFYVDAVTAGTAGIESFVPLGGFQRLSAYSRGKVSGPDVALAGLFAYRRFGGPYVPFYTGIGLESGSAWPDVTEARWADLNHSFSAFTGMDTFLGPLQLSVTVNEDNSWGALLNMGFSLDRLS
ncbi:MAG: patatin-like phospholipase family protein, partial [Marinobacter sp.]|nr:patatin-like phospholipase family protein [Marinobacter sp.]